MARLNINGRIRYSDNSTPVANARVRIYDLDGLGQSGEHDEILDRTTGPDGRFSGLSQEWNDREGQTFLGAIPDVLRLEYLVNAGGKTYRGMFFRADNGSATISLPVPPPKPVAKADRELVQIIVLSADYTGGEKALYQFIETSTEALTNTLLGGSYRKVTFLKGANGTLQNFVAALGAAAGNPATEAVDVIFNTHGSTNRMVFADQTHLEATVKDALLGLPASSRAKFRCLFSTACFGETHNDTWIAAGFNESSGSKGIYADSAVSYAPFLATWAAEKTFAEAVDAANNIDPLNLADTAARIFYERTNRPGQAVQVNSDRGRAGRGTTRIYTTP